MRAVCSQPDHSSGVVLALRALEDVRPEKPAINFEGGNAGCDHQLSMMLEIVRISMKDDGGHDR